jgi:tetratricopeptide (TPR) repeat protein
LASEIEQQIKMSEISADIERFTQLGYTLLQRREDDKAIKFFRIAVNKAKTSSDDVQLKTSINLGAAFVAVHRPREALKIFNSAVKVAMEDPSLAGDLFYNVALMHEQLGNRLEARKSYQKSFDFYAADPDNKLLQAGVACKLAVICSELSESQSAAAAWDSAAALYESADLREQQAMCLYQKVRALDTCGHSADAAKTANECKLLCDSVEPSLAVGMLSIFFYALVLFIYFCAAQLLCWDSAPTVDCLLTVAGS